MLDEIHAAAAVEKLPALKNRYAESEIQDPGEDGVYYFPYGSTHPTYNFPAERPAEIKYPSKEMKAWKSVGDQ